MKKKINKKELLKKVAKRTRISYETCLKVTDTLMLQIMEDVSDEIDVNLKGFGLFSRRTKHNLNGIDCKTGKPFVLEKPYHTPIFSPARKFKNIVKIGYREDEYIDNLEEDMFDD